jgi:ParB-like chromosome segregation protein Spo0J
MAKRTTKPDLSHIAEPLRPLAVCIDSLTLDPANTRHHPEKNLDGIRGSLRVYGQVKPVVVRKETGVVVAGNGTVEAARSLGWTHLAAAVVDMDAATAAGFSIADNRTAELATWDNDALSALLHSVSTGNDPDLDAMLAELAAQQGIVPPDFQPAGLDEQGRLDEKAKTTCPECGHEF